MPKFPAGYFEGKASSGPDMIEVRYDNRVRKPTKPRRAKYLDSALVRRHHELVDKKHLGTITRQEGKELIAICRLMDIREEPYNAGVIKKLRQILRAKRK